MADLAALTYEDFAPLQGSRFLLHPGPGSQPESMPPIPLDLIEVTAGIQRGGRQPFSLVFRGPRGLRAPQRIYHLEHETLGELDVFLVPIQPDALGPCFEAAFN
jgi:hypothetical protein